MWYNDLRPDQELNNDRFALIMLDAKNNYKRLLTDPDKKRTIKGLLELKKGLEQEVPDKKVGKNLLLASWNIKNFGTIKDRTAESLYYIAEIISAFDIVAIQEINSNITQFKQVLRLLGSNWKHTLSDVTEGIWGNDERFGFIYDSERVTHSGLSGELVIPPESIDANPIVSQLKRTPTFTGFESEWKKFSVISVHLHPGDGNNGDGPTDQEIRKEEVRLLMELLAEKMETSAYEDRNMIILGDTNLYEEDTDIVQLITDQGFEESDGLRGKYTNTSLSQIYDRIFFNTDEYFKLVVDSNGKQRGGVFNPFEFVYRNEPEEILNYHELMLAHKDDPSTLTDDGKFTYYFNRYWKRDQISDHLPIWIEIQANSSAEFLQNKFEDF